MTEAPAKKPRRGAGKVAFLAHLETFKELFQAGHEQRTVFDQYENELGISYSQFNRYHAKYIGTGATANGHQKEGRQQKQEAPASTPAASTGALSGKGDASPTPSLGSSTGSKTGKQKPVFQHDPSSGNTRQDLI